MDLHFLPSAKKCTAFPGAIRLQLCLRGQKREKRDCGKWRCNYLKMFSEKQQQQKLCKDQREGGCTQGQLKNNRGQLLSNSLVHSIALPWYPPICTRGMVSGIRESKHLCDCLSTIRFEVVANSCYQSTTSH